MKLGWEKYYNPLTPRLLTLPQPMTIKLIAELAKKRLGISTVRIVGDLKPPCTTIYLAFGYMDPKAQIPVIQQMQPDLILSGETREWETVERVRDGLAMGQKTSLLVLSHAVSEEAGMEYAAHWLQPMIPDVEITYIASNPFTFL
ncbi:Nif3-like dinuclear metal center hexameric protein [Segetibacter koreensis]|uniref:Nif3-like dinuclear metal center hexameric protein n=1 Tax=Segetibacter koreensis TaxID=398037 RepID=UPI001FE1E1CC